ncbi:MAG TPA: nuclear transport factor 2 family protein [Candidatus Acidoferrum sp.]|nr:nuclear transport factor 2 family protein [Candidatus Acidoferrum sp.]
MRIRGSALGLATFAVGFIAICGLMLEAHKHAAAAPVGAEAPIRDLLAKQQAAWNAGDVDAFLLGYWDSKELTFSGSGGITRGFAGVRERYRKSYPDRQAMGELDFSDLEVRELGADAALVLGHWHLKRSRGDVGGVFSLVFQRFPEGWRIIHDHTSVVTPSPG